MAEKVNLNNLDSMKESFNKMQSMSKTSMEGFFKEKLDELREVVDDKTKELHEEIEDVYKKLDEMDAEEGSYDEEEESD